MIRKLLLVGAILAGLSLPARADFTFTLGAGATAFSFTSTTGGTALCAAASTHCFAHVNVNSAGAEIGTAGNPFRTNPTGTTAQPITAAAGSLASGASVDIGSQADAACATATGTCSLIALTKKNNQNLEGAVPAGTNVIGDIRNITGTFTTIPTFKIDQTTPGTTNAVAFTNTTLAVTNTGTFAVQAASTLAAETIKVIGTVRVSAMAAASRNAPGCTVGTSSAQCLAAAQAVNFLQIQNVNATSTNNVACNIAGGTAVLNSATSVQLAPGQSASWGVNTGGVPSGAINCIATSASSPLYVEWN